MDTLNNIKTKANKFNEKIKCYQTHHHLGSLRQEHVVHLIYLSRRWGVHLTPHEVYLIYGDEQPKVFRVMSY